MIVYKVYGIEDDVIMAMPLVDVGSNHILVLALEPFVRKLFPDFVDRFNELIEPDKRLVMPSSDTLSTEMRVFALMRLGITESERIAIFLRRSTSTIYNYRVKMRNAAIGDRDEFEEKVMKIGL